MYFVDQCIFMDTVHLLIYETRILYNYMTALQLL